MTAQTTTQRTTAHRRRMAEKMARLEKGLREIAESGPFQNPYAAELRRIARYALNPTNPAKS